MDIREQKKESRGALSLLILLSIIIVLGMLSVAAIWIYYGNYFESEETQEEFYIIENGHSH